MDYNKEYETLKEKVIDKYNYWYLRDVLIDIEEDGQVEYLIDDHDEFLHNVELSKELKEIIDYMIWKNNYEVDSLVKFLDLKRITDKRVVDNPQYDETFVNEFLFDIKDKSNSNTQKPLITLNPSVKNQKEILTKTYTFLKGEGFIDSSKDEFLSHFEPSKDWDSKINWVGDNLMSLVGLIDNLFIKNILPKNQKRKLRNKTILNHFKNENGDLNLGSIKTYGSKLYETRHYKEINQFINSIKIDFD